MTTSAKVILDSISPNGVRLTTLEVTMHRFVLAEFNTHRVFSRNSASSRAIPVHKTLKRVVDEPAWPSVWVCEQPGMSGGADLEGEFLKDAQDLFVDVHASTLGFINNYLNQHPDPATRLHKSLINRLLEPFMWHTVIVTSTYWDNFWGLRCHPKAQPEMRLAAEAMEEAYNFSTPMILGYGQWHMPYIDKEEVAEARELGFDPRQVSAARCARVSYLTHDGHRDFGEDIRLYRNLTVRDEPDDPMHSSPLEHIATPSGSPQAEIPGNFEGWYQLRHMVERNEVIDAE